MTEFFSFTRFEQLGLCTSKSKTAGVIKDRNDINMAPFREIIRSRSGVVATARTENKVYIN